MAKEDSKREQQKHLALQKRYGQRITIARQGREAFLAKDYINASKKYNEYLGILAESKDMEDIYKLSPAMFDNKTQVTELLLISHVYWELARIHEMAPKLQGTFHKALSQFVKFTSNQPYQVFNSEMLRKYIKKNKRVSSQIGYLNEAYSQIQVQSKKCFIATEVFGENAAETNQLRIFKNELSSWPLGTSIIALYYRISTLIINFKERDNIFAIIFLSKIRTPLLIFAKFTQTSIFKKCSSYLKL
jgi:hypothetical protein